MIKNNALAHQKAAKIGVNIIEDKSIKKVDWPVNSPDLHPIKDFWNWKKEMLSPKWKELKGTKKRVQEIA